MAAKPTYFIDPSGQVVEVPAEQAADAGSLGYVPASPEQAQDFQRQDRLAKKFGTPGQATIAGLEAFARTATFGASDVASRALGMPAEDLAAREQVNPGAVTAGTVTGVAVPLIAGFGGPSLAAKAGSGVTAAVEAALPEATSLAGRIATRAAAMGAGSAIEGAAYGAGQVVHEAALGDPNLTAQSALATIGMSALIGGGFGAAAGAAGGALSSLTKKAAESDIGAKLSTWLEDFEGERNIKAAGAVKQDITRAAKRKGEAGLKKIGRELADYDLVGPFSTPADTLERAESLLAQGQSEAQAVASAADASPRAVRVAWSDLRAKIEPDIMAGLKAKGSTVKAAEQVKGVLDDFDAAYAGAELAPGDLWKLRQDLDAAIGYRKNNIDPFQKAIAKPLKKVRDFVAEALEDGLEVAGQSKEAWAAANRKMEVALTAREFAEAGLRRAHGNNLVSLTEGLGTLGGVMDGGVGGGLVGGTAVAAARRYGSGLLGSAARGLRNLLDGGAAESAVAKTAEAIAAERAAGIESLASVATNAPETVAALSQLERANQAVANKINRATAMLVRGTSAAANVGRGEALAGVSHLFGDSADEAVASHQRRFAQIQQLSDDPERMQTTLEAHASDLHGHAPQTAQAMNVATARAVAFLRSKLPQPPQRGPLAPKWVPSQAEVARFNRYYEAVNKPTSILKQAAAGTLTKEAVEAVANVYPELYGKIQAALVEKMAAHPKGTPYKNKLMLSMLLGQDVDGTTSPSMILGNQRALTGPSNKGPMNTPGMPGALKPTSKGIGKVTVSSRLLTPMQASASRR